mgnify:CR=1 FL=1
MKQFIGQLSLLLFIVSASFAIPKRDNAHKLPKPDMGFGPWLKIEITCMPNSSGEIHCGYISVEIPTSSFSANFVKFHWTEDGFEDAIQVNCIRRDYNEIMVKNSPFVPYGIEPMVDEVIDRTCLYLKSLD